MSTSVASCGAYELDTVENLQQPSAAPTDRELAAPGVDFLPPTDHGHGAYVALACCTLAQAPVWGKHRACSAQNGLPALVPPSLNDWPGYATSFGIFQEYYTRSTEFHASAGAFASIGSSQQGVMYLMMPLTFILLNRHPSLRRWCGPLGLVVTVCSLSSSAFVHSITGLIATQGALYAIGCSLLFSPISLYMDEWWVERKGFAYGVMWAGKSGVGVAMPFIFSACLDRFGLRVTLLGWAMASALLTLPTLLFLKPRAPLPAASSPRSLSFAFLRKSSFWMMQIGIVVQSLGYMMPSTYLASYASAIGLPSITGPILIALFAAASVPGSFVHGLLGDKLTATKLILISSLGSALPVFLLWGLSRRLAVMIVFVLLYGFFAGGFSSTWSSMLHRIRREDASADTSVVFGLLLGGRGLGFVLVGPVSGALLSSQAQVAGDAFGYATKYGPMMLFTGTTAIFGAWASLWTIMKMIGSRSSTARRCPRTR